MMQDGVLNKLRKSDELGPIRARSDLVEILSQSPKNTKAIVRLIQAELKDLKDSDIISELSDAITEVAAKSNVNSKTRKNVLYWLTQTTPDVRQMILVQTLEELLELECCRESTLKALVKVSSKENVDMVMAWVDRKILTLNQAVYVLLYPDASSAIL
ncbi:MAG: hypothetical protein C4K48_00090 [Candidatus Thorarchaeota archaeon]|nr:MAG: hypothetical protein C4K48_00090 [Candidatus Thorarchaeota archaeon]